MINLDEIWEVFTPNKHPAIERKELKCDCEISDTIMDEFSTVCRECGLVVESFNIDFSQEWNTYSSDSGFTSTNGGERCGYPASNVFGKQNLSTVISGNSYMSKINSWSQFSYDERIMHELKKTITEIVVKQNLPSGVVNNTLILYKEIFSSKHIFRGKNIKGIIAVCFYLASKSLDCAVPTDNVLEIFELDLKTYSKCYKLYSEISHIDDILTENNYSKYINGYCDKLGLTFKIQKLCENIFEACKEINILISVNPKSIIAGILMFVITELNIKKINKTTVINTINISENTLNKVLKILNKNKDLIFNVVYKNKN